jgi:hypothetical protein
MVGYVGPGRVAGGGGMGGARTERLLEIIVLWRDTGFERTCLSGEAGSPKLFLRVGGFE